MRSIVVGVLGDPVREPALDLALAEAVTRRLPLEVVHALEPPVFGEVPVDLASSREAATARVEAAVERARDRVDPGRSARVTVLVLDGDPVTCVTSRAETAALVVLGSRRLGGWARALRGSVGTGCLHHCLGPVLVVPDTAELPADRWLRSRVVVGVDGSAASLSALQWAAAQAAEWRSDLVPVVVLGSDGQPPLPLRGPEPLEDRLAVLLSEAGADGLTVLPRVASGRPAEQLRGLVEPTDLLVVGSQGRSPLAGLLSGGTSTPVAESARCPVAVVRAGQVRRETHQRRARALYARD